MPEIIGEKGTQPRYKYSVTVYDYESGKSKSFSFSTEKTKTVEDARDGIMALVRDSKTL